MHSRIKRNVLQHKINTKKLKLGLVAFYDIRPGNFKHMKDDLKNKDMGDLGHGHHQCHHTTEYVRLPFSFQSRKPCAYFVPLSRCSTLFVENHKFFYAHAFGTTIKGDPPVEYY